MKEVSDTILIADDNDDDVFALTRALRKAGVTNPVQVVTHGRQAIDYLGGAGEFIDRSRWPFPCLVFLDLKMPLCDGFEVLAWLRQRAELSWLPVVVLSGSDERRDHQRAYALGARTYLLKPPATSDLRTIFAALHTMWNVPATPPRTA